MKKERAYLFNFPVARVLFSVCVCAGALGCASQIDGRRIAAGLPGAVNVALKPLGFGRHCRIVFGIRRRCLRRRRRRRRHTLCQPHINCDVSLSGSQHNEYRRPSVGRCYLSVAAVAAVWPCALSLSTRSAYWTQNRRLNARTEITKVWP